MFRDLFNVFYRFAVLITAIDTLNCRMYHKSEYGIITYNVLYTRHYTL